MKQSDRIYIAPRKPPRIPRRYQQLHDADDNGDTMLGVVLWVIVMALFWLCVWLVLR